MVLYTLPPGWPQTTALADRCCPAHYTDMTVERHLSLSFLWLTPTLGTLRQAPSSFLQSQLLPLKAAINQQHRNSSLALSYLQWYCHKTSRLVFPAWRMGVLLESHIVYSSSLPDNLYELIKENFRYRRKTGGTVTINRVIWWLYGAVMSLLGHLIWAVVLPL